MGKNIKVDFQAVDFEMAVDEVDILVPKYLESLEHLESVETMEEIPARLQHVEAYWERLTGLFAQLEPLEADVPFEEIKRNSLQSELSSLERVYLMVNLRIEFSEGQWTKFMWRAGEAVLNRMDVVLERLDFGDDHEDRMLLQEMLLNNAQKEQRWRKRGRATG